MITFDSTIFAIVTPSIDSRRVDFNGIHVYLNWLYANGVRTILVNGTTGEFPSLPLQQRCDILETAKKSFPGVIITNVTATCMDDTLYLADHAQRYSDAILVSPPFYYTNLDGDGLLRYFDYLFSSICKPIFIYNIPQFVGFSVSDEVIFELQRRHDNFVGIKDSSGNVYDPSRFRKHKIDFRIYLGNDFLASQAVRLGFDGVVTGSANPIPEIIIGIAVAVLENDMGRAHYLQGLLNCWSVVRQDIGAEIPCIKAALSLRLKTISPLTFLPITSLSQEHISRIGRLLSQLHESLDSAKNNVLRRPQE